MDLFLFERLCFYFFTGFSLTMWLSAQISMHSIETRHWITRNTKSWREVEKVMEKEKKINQLGSSCFLDYMVFLS